MGLGRHGSRVGTRVKHPLHQLSVHLGATSDHLNTSDTLWDAYSKATILKRDAASSTMKVSLQLLTPAWCQACSNETT